MHDPKQRIKEILRTVKPLAAEYYKLTGKPLGVTGEVAEYLAADILGLELAPARTAGHDALRRTAERVEKIQIKGRAFGPEAKPGQRLGRIKTDADCDTVMLVLMDSATLDAREIWEAPYRKVVERLSRPGSAARARGQLAVSDFKKIATRQWSCADTDAQRYGDGADRTCPVCGKEFRGSWGGIDAHWRARHEKVMPYEEAWPLIKAGTYASRRETGLRPRA